MPNGLFITGTGTDIGKSYAAGFLLSMMGLLKHKVLYYKPIQCGLPGDAGFMRNVIKHKFTASSYDLKTPSSPHFAFAKEGIQFDIGIVKKFLSQAKKKFDFILMEGAGGVRTPITEKFDMADLAKASKFPALVVALPTLGTINHTLLTIDYLRSKNVKIHCFIFSWQKDVDFTSEMILDNAAAIERLSGVKFEGFVPKFPHSA